ncbi:Phosphatidylglycerol phosphatidylinositol transfer protein [Rutstroemia sp. NJR-2017a BBW]|nr:Phosphatidylglycerol phosphatidylinositol transfer protein [Rutstroemia sp. NJR-2017a BBW]
MLLWVIYVLFAVVVGRAINEGRQHVLVPESQSVLGRLPGDSIVKLNEEVDVMIWGNLMRDISAYSTVDYQINATANTGDVGALNGTFHICDYLEKMHQPPDSNEPEKACPPSKGPVFIDYSFWFADFLVAPGQWSVQLDAKTPDGDRIYCLQTEFDLQCRPGYDGPECLRNASDTLRISWML